MDDYTMLLNNSRAPIKDDSLLSIFIRVIYIESFDRMGGAAGRH